MRIIHSEQKGHYKIDITENIRFDNVTVFDVTLTDTEKYTNTGSTIFKCQSYSKAVDLFESISKTVEIQSL
jgi:hypothetical protein